MNSVSRELHFTRGSSAFADTAYAPDGADHIVDGTSMIAQFVSAEIPAQTILAQAIGIHVRAFEAAASNQLFLTWKLYATNVAGDSVLGTLVALTRTSASEIAAASHQGRSDVRTSTEFVAAANFRLVLEIGVGGLPINSATDTHNATMEFGETYTGAQDLIQNADTGQGPSMLVFSADVSLAAAAANNPVGRSSGV